MKLCWDNIENIKLSSRGNFRDIVNNITYYLKICEVCGDEFLGYKKYSKICSRACNQKGKNNSFYGKHHSEKTIDQIKNSTSGKNNYWYGKKLSKETKKRISKSRLKKYGGYYSKNIPTYDTYASQLEWVEKVRRNKQDPNILEVQCFKCGKWYVPNLNNVGARIRHLINNKKYTSESLFYCSDKCRNSCSVYYKSVNSIMKEDAVRAGRLSWLELEREVQPELRQMVLERDSYKCVKCDNNIEELQCHHIMPVNIEPLLSADIDNCITLCKDCHIKVHKQDGCRYGQLRIREC
jgi:hypothetical protein